MPPEADSRATADLASLFGEGEPSGLTTLERRIIRLSREYFFDIFSALRWVGEEQMPISTDMVKAATRLSILAAMEADELLRELASNLRRLSETPQ